MHRAGTWLIMGLVLLLLTACTATTGGEKIKVKCPACSYEFDVERYGR